MESCTANFVLNCFSVKYKFHDVSLQVLSLFILKVFHFFSLSIFFQQKFGVLFSMLFFSAYQIKMRSQVISTNLNLLDANLLLLYA